MNKEMFIVDISLHCTYGIHNWFTNQVHKNSANNYGGHIMYDIVVNMQSFYNS